MPARDPSGRVSAGGTYRRPPKRKSRPRPVAKSIPQQRTGPVPKPRVKPITKPSKPTATAPKPDVTLGGDKTPKRSGHKKPRSPRSGALERSVKNTRRRERKERKQDKARAKVKAQRDAGRMFARLPKPGRPSDIGLERDKDDIKRRLDRALDQIPNPEKPREVAESIQEQRTGPVSKPRVAPTKVKTPKRQPKVPKVAKTLEDKAFEQNARPQAVKGYKAERKREPRLQQQAERTRTKVDREIARKKAKKEREDKERRKKLRFAGPTKTSGPSLSDIVGGGVGGAVDILEETTRPIHAIAASTRATLQHGSLSEAGSAFVKGLKNEDKSTFSDVLGDMGVPKGAARSVAGFAGDVALDPLTYVSFGAAAPVKAAATKAGQAAAKKAAKAGMSKSGQATVRRAAEKRVLREAERTGKGLNKGIRAGLGRKKTSGKTTAAVSRKLGAGKLATTVRERPLTQEAGAILRPGFQRKGVPAKQRAEVAQLQAERRASIDTAERRLEKTAENFHKLGAKDQQRILDAVGSGSLKSLKSEPKLHEAAVRLRSDLRHMGRVEQRAGVRSKLLKNYVARVRKQDVEAKPGRGIYGKRPSAPRTPGSAKGRGLISATNMRAELQGLKEAGAPKEQIAALESRIKTFEERSPEATLAELRDERPDLFTEEVSKILAQRGEESLRSVARAQFERALAGVGRPLTAKSYADLGEGEAIYRISGKAGSEGAGLRKVYPVQEKTGQALREVEAALEGSGKPGQYVLLNERLTDDVLDAAAPLAPGPLHARYRKWHGRYKTALTMPMPSYHLRNLYGDTHNAWQEEATHELAAGLGRSLRGMGELRRMRKGEGKLTLTGKGATKGKRVRVAEGWSTHAKELQLAEKHNGLNSGFSRDLHELLGQKSHTGIGGKLRNLGEMRENMVRYAVYLTERRKGATPAQASKKARDTLIDYGDLTKTERAVRDFIPFYTFTARNTYNQASRLLRRPGKLATYQKFVEEGAKAAGLPDDWQQNIEDYQKLGVPIPAFGLQAGGRRLIALPQLPVTDLNRITADPVEQFFLTAQMFSGLKAIPEVAANYSVFFRDSIDNEGRQVAAPDWLHHVVGQLPEEWQKRIELEYGYDPALKKKVWKYNATFDYLLKQLPETRLLFDITSSGKNRRGQGAAQKLLSLSGVNLQPYQPLNVQTTELYEDQAAVTRRIGQLNDQGVYMDNASKKGAKGRELKRLNARSKKLTERIDAIKLHRFKRGEEIKLPKHLQDEQKKDDYFDDSSSGNTDDYFEEDSGSDVEGYFDD